MPHLSTLMPGAEPPRSTGAFRQETHEPLWRAWARPVFIVAVVTVLVALGIANVAMRAKWHEVEDGVLWGARAEGVTALDVAPDSPAAASGMRSGDVLLAVNGVPVETPADVVEYQHSGTEGTTLSYTVLRIGSREAFSVSLAETARPASMYFFLAAVGLFTLIVGASVRLRRPRDQATLHFFWLCVAFLRAASCSAALAAASASAFLRASSAAALAAAAGSSCAEVPCKGRLGAGWVWRAWSSSRLTREYSRYAKNPPAPMTTPMTAKMASSGVPRLFLLGGSRGGGGGTAMAAGPLGGMAVVGRSLGGMSEPRGSVASCARLGLGRSEVS